MKNFVTLLKKLTATLLIAAVLTGSSAACDLPNYDDEIMTLRVDDAPFFDKTTVK